MRFENDQAVFDHVVSSLVKQGRPAAVWHGYSAPPDTGGVGCLYRSNDGAKCAGGWCIEDEEYEVTMEGRGIRSVISSGFFFLNRLEPFSELLNRLQGCHDAAAKEAWDIEAKAFDNAKWVECFLHLTESVKYEFRLKDPATVAA